MFVSLQRYQIAIRFLCVSYITLTRNRLVSGRTCLPPKMPFRSVVEARLKPNAATGRRIRWSERPGPWTNMRTLLRFALAWLIVGHAAGGLNSQGPQCGDVRCSAFEHCSDYHGQCEHCSSVCDETDTNYQLEVCQRKCQGKLGKLPLTILYRSLNIQKLSSYVNLIL